MTKADDLSSAKSAAELSRLACDLHDNVLPSIWALGLRVRQASEALTEGRYQQAQAIVEELGRATRESYEMLREVLVAAELSGEPSDLGQEIERIAEALEARGLIVETEIGEAPPFPPSVQYHIRSIAREALRNIERHARAAHVRLHARQEQDSWVLTIDDDGQGIHLAATERTAESGGFGLQVMQRRAAMIGGRCVVSSQAGAGTSVRLEVPIDVNQWRNL